MCPLIRHEYTYSTVCGLIKTGWVTLNSDQHVVGIETPDAIPPAALSVQVVQTVEEVDGKVYASSS